MRGSQSALIGYEQVMKNINSEFAERISSVRQLFVETAKEMLWDFRARQQSAEVLKTKTKGQDEETANENVRKAIEYAEAHSNNERTERDKTWINRTQRAVRAVNATVDATPEEISIKLSHGIYYGAYLEYAHNRKYAVLEPLIRKYAPELIEQTKKIMGGG
jgi:hypothetical protein